MSNVFLLIISASALVALLAVAPPWRRRRSFGQSLLELDGEVDALDSESAVDPAKLSAGEFSLRTPNTTHQVICTAATTGARLPRVGRRLRVYGIAAHRRADETHYRDAGIEHVVEALAIEHVATRRVLRGATLLALAVALATTYSLVDQRFSRPSALLLHTASQIRCPAGTERVTAAAGINLFTHFCADAAGAKQGPFGIWSATGRLRQRGTYRDGKRVGRLIEIDPPAVHYHGTCFVAGQPHNRANRCNAIARVSTLDADGLRHGTVEGYYYPHRKLAFRGQFDRGRRVGRWTYFHPRGATLYWVDHAKTSRYTYRDERDGHHCSDGGAAAQQWQLADADRRCHIICLAAGKPAERRLVPRCTHRRSLATAANRTQASPPGLRAVTTRARYGAVSVIGLAPKGVVSVLRRHVNELRYCYARRTWRPRTASVEIKFAVYRSGFANEVKISGLLHDGRIASCIEHALRRWQFPTPSFAAARVAHTLTLSTAWRKPRHHAAAEHKAANAL